MIKFSVYLVILICALCAQHAISQSTRAPDARDLAGEIKHLEAERSKAQVKGDVRRLEELLAPEFVEISATGQVRTKAENIEGHRSGQTHWQAFDLDELNVQVHGETAVVTGRLTRKGSFAGRDLSGQSRYTRYYVRRQGHWQAIFQHSIPEK